MCRFLEVVLVISLSATSTGCWRASAAITSEQIDAEMEECQQRLTQEMRDEG